MTSSPPSSSEDRPGSVFERFHPGIQRWIWRQGWRELRPIQERTARPILGAERDVLIAAATASGKTEAAFLPIASSLASTPARGVGCLAVSPLKALINDQFDRLEEIGDAVEIAVHRWHGDVAQSRKTRFLRRPSGILLITPESLEALFVRRGTRIPTLFAGLRYVVIDELHAFLGSERGRQLQTLLHRLELAIRRRVPRIGLSATLGDLTLAAEFLRPRAGEDVFEAVDDEAGRELKLQLRGYLRTAPRLSPAEARKTQEGGREITPEDTTEGDLRTIAAHLFELLRGTDNLIFANSRRRVEALADLLRRKAERLRVPNEFLPHHGSLSRDLRHDAEARVKDPTRPGNLLCTTTLEMGIDVGSVSSIAQIGCPPSVAALRQRLGRSGRREDEPAVLRLFVSERELDPRTPLQDALRARLVQTVAMVELMLRRWYEPPPEVTPHLSTLVQQILSLIAQHGGVRAQEAWQVLCGSGPFANVDPAVFATLLRELGRHDFLVQTGSGELVLGVVGEQLVEHYSFYSAFAVPEEFRLVTAGRTLGSMPIVDPVMVGTCLIFAGRRWRVVDVDVRARVIDLAPAAGGKPPLFGGGGFRIHAEVRREMRRIYAGQEIPVYLDAGARRLLAEGRASFRRYGLDRRSLVAEGGDSLIFPWIGDRGLHALLLILRAHGLETESHGLALAVSGATPAAIRTRASQIVAREAPDPVALARAVTNKEAEKYDRYLPEALLCVDFAARALDVPEAMEALRRLTEEE